MHEWQMFQRYLSHTPVGLRSLMMLYLRSLSMWLEFGHDKDVAYISVCVKHWSNGQWNGSGWHQCPDLPWFSWYPWNGWKRLTGCNRADLAVFGDYMFALLSIDVSVLLPFLIIWAALFCLINYWRKTICVPYQNGLNSNDSILVMLLVCIDDLELYKYFHSS